MNVVSAKPWNTYVYVGKQNNINFNADVSSVNVSYLSVKHAS